MRRSQSGSVHQRGLLNSILYGSEGKKIEVK